MTSEEKANMSRRMRLVVDTLRTGGWWTCSRIYTRLPGLGLTTVQRWLPLMSEWGVVERRRVGRTFRYRLVERACVYRAVGEPPPSALHDALVRADEVLP